MQNLAQLTERIREEYAQMHSCVVPTGSIRMAKTGHLCTAKNEFPFRCEGMEQFAGKIGIPKQFFKKMPPDIRALLFNRCFQMAVSDGKFGADVRINLDRDKQVVGFDDPNLLRISPIQLADVICSSLPKSLSPEQVSISRFSSTPRRLCISCFSPKIISEPRPDDIINGGVDVNHYLAGNKETQVSCYLRRLVCENGATTHVCGENKNLRARRLRNGRFDEQDMLNQIGRLLEEAWGQLQEKLDAVKALLEKKRVPIDFLRQQRTKYSLNNKILEAVEEAIHRDELGTTDSQYDIFNALSRVSTHIPNLTFRQHRTLSRMAGEFSQQTVHKCDKCGQWVVVDN